jgi:hypothetical protein
MNDKIDGLLEACSTRTDRLAEKRLDWRIAVVGFGDLTVRGDKIVVTDFTDRVETVRGLLKRIPRFDGANATSDMEDAAGRAYRIALGGTAGRIDRLSRLMGGEAFDQAGYGL